MAVRIGPRRPPKKKQTTPGSIRLRVVYPAVWEEHLDLDEILLDADMESGGGGGSLVLFQTLGEILDSGCRMSPGQSRFYNLASIKSGSKFHQKSDYEPDFGPIEWILTWEGDKTFNWPCFNVQK